MDLQGDLPTTRLLLSLVDDAHATAARFAGDLEIADDLSGSRFGDGLFLVQCVRVDQAVALLVRAEPGLADVPTFHGDSALGSVRSRFPKRRIPFPVRIRQLPPHDRAGFLQQILNVNRVRYERQGKSIDTMLGLQEQLHEVLFAIHIDRRIMVISVSDVL